MTLRKVKRMLNESDDFLVFTMKQHGENADFGAFYQKLESWEILLNLAISDYHIRETLRNVLTAADAYRDAQAEDSPE